MGTERASKRSMLDHVSRSTTLAVLACAMLACSRESRVTMDSAAGGAVDSASGTSVEPETAAAISLLKTLADREETLLEIARIAVTRREQLEVSGDARRILSDQRRESNRVLGMLKGEFQTTHRPTVTEQEQSLVDTLNASGVGEFDSIFLGVVAKHHEDDVRLIDAALPRIKHPAVREFATSIRQQRATAAADLRKRFQELPSGS